MSAMERTAGLSLTTRFAQAAAELSSGWTRGLETVRVAGVDVVDATFGDTVDALATVVPERPVLAFALHVGGMNAAADLAVVEAYADADLTYADGAAAVALGRLAGAASMERTPTTDLGHTLVERLRDDGRDRVFLLGGPPGLAEAAAGRLEEDHGTAVVGTMGGYDLDSADFVDALWRTRPDLVFVGLGSPREMLFLTGLRSTLPAALYVTCGGWFGFLAGGEERAPVLLQRCGLEWVWRLKQQPRRLGPRYLRGMWTTFRLALVLLVRGS